MAIYYNTNIVRTGLALYYDPSNTKSYSGSGASIFDLSGNSRTGTLINGPVYNSSGFISYDGSNDYIDTGVTPTNLGIYDAPYTMMAVFRVPNLSGDKMVFGTPTTNTRLGMHHGVRDNTFYFGHYSADAAGGTAVANTWYHGVWMWTTTSPYQRIYINGSLVASSNQASFLSTDNIRIGYSWTPFTGDIALTQIYNRELTTDEMNINFSSARSRFGI